MRNSKLRHRRSQLSRRDLLLNYAEVVPGNICMLVAEYTTGKDALRCVAW